MKKIIILFVTLCYVFNAYSQSDDPKTIFQEINNNGKKICELVNSELSEEASKKFYSELSAIKENGEYLNIVNNYLGSEKGGEFNRLLNNTSENFGKLSKANYNKDDISSLFDNSKVEYDRNPCGDGTHQQEYEECIEQCEINFDKEKKEAILNGFSAASGTAGAGAWLITAGGGTPASLAGVVVVGTVSTVVGLTMWAGSYQDAERNYNLCTRICTRRFCGDSNKELEGGGGGPGGGYKTTDSTK